MLNDQEIQKAMSEGHLDIEPYEPARLQPVSYDLTLHHHLEIPDGSVHTIDPALKHEPDRTTYYGKVPPHGVHTEPRMVRETGYRLRAGDFVLACTEEIVTLSPEMAARVEGKSSLGRLGMAVHITAGFIDPGFSGQITLEIANLAPWAIMLYPGMPIAQIVFEPVNPPERTYNDTGRYQDQRGPTPSRYTLP